MNRIKELREERNLSTRLLEPLINISYASISHYENEKRDIPTAYIKLLSSFFNVSSDYLLGDKDGLLYAFIEGSNIKVNFTNKEYIKFRNDNPDMIYFKDNIRYIRLDKNDLINRYKDNIKNADNITSIDYKYIK